MKIYFEDKPVKYVVVIKHHKTWKVCMLFLIAVISITIGYTTYLIFSPVH